jgi:hypothetical protein
LRRLDATAPAPGRFPRGLLPLTLALAVLPAVLARPAGATPSPVVAQLAWSVLLPDNVAGGFPVAESSPNVANLSGGPAVVVGDRYGTMYALHLADGSVVPGWGTAGAPGITPPGNIPIDSTPSVAPLDGSGLDSVFFGSGNADVPGQGGYQAYGPSGSPLWFTPVVDPPTDAHPFYGVQASLSLGNFQGALGVVAGSLDQEEYALDAHSGAVLPGWPFFASDSIFSTAALADLYGTGQSEIIEGSDQTAGFGNGQHYTDGGHLRILNARGGLICHSDTNQTVDSSPAVGGFLSGGATGVVVGTGSFFVGAPDTGTVKAFDTACSPVWSTQLDGVTFSSPALADIGGSGVLSVLEGTDNGASGSVWALDGATGHPLWHQSLAGRVIGSVVTADLTGAGYQDAVVPTTAGVVLLDGRTGAPVGTLPQAPGCPAAYQNSPLITNDGTIGITVAGYRCYGTNGQGQINHYEIAGSNGSLVHERGAWPMFHHDGQLTGNAGGTPGPGSVPSCAVPAAAFSGYNLVASDGGIFSFGGQPFCGSTGNLTLNEPIVGMAMAPNTGGYWLVAADGGVFAYGGAQFYGSMGGQNLNQPIVGITATPDGRGYWMVAADGGIFSFGDAAFYGSTGALTLVKPIVGMEVTADGQGYRLVAADGGVFAFGGAQFFGSTGDRHLVSPIVGMAQDVGTGGYWLVAADGGVFAFEAPFLGSIGGHPLAAPVVGIQATADGQGYRFVATDGGVFAYGTAPFSGSMGARPLNRPIVGMAGF